MYQSNDIYYCTVYPQSTDVNKNASLLHELADELSMQMHRSDHDFL